MLKMTWSIIYQQQIGTNGGNYVNWKSTRVMYLRKYFELNNYM